MIQKLGTLEKLKNWFRKSESWKTGENDRDEWSTSGKLRKNIENGDMKVGELVKKIQTNESKVGKVGRSARRDQEECMKPEQDALLAEAGEENEFVKCFDDVAGKEMLRQAVKEAHEKELTCLRELWCVRKG